MTTSRPAASAGRTTSATCWARSASMSSSLGPRRRARRWRVASSTSRSRRPDLRPARLAGRAPRRAASASRRAWVDLPQPSPPSRATNHGAGGHRLVAAAGSGQAGVVGGGGLLGGRLLGRRAFAAAFLAVALRAPRGRLLRRRPCAASARRRAGRPAARRRARTVISSMRSPRPIEALVTPVGDVHAEAALLGHDGLARHGVVAEGRPAAASAAPAPAELLRAWPAASRASSSVTVSSRSSLSRLRLSLPLATYGP